METSQLICVANWLTGFFVIREMRSFHLISGWGGFCWTRVLQIFGQVSPESAETVCFCQKFSRWGVE